jgi:phospholipase/lecithinase/hemolysin
MPENISNVVVFGDSLSDIGIKWTSATGKLALGLGMMTVSASGRFSDSRNWTDFMYEEASGDSLVQSGAGATIAASQIHQKFTSGSSVTVTGAQPFNYANYAEGGACGGIPSALGKKGALGTFKDQVKAFTKDYLMVKQPPGSRTLFLVWFGANDLYTAECKNTAMADLAEKVAVTRRNELAALVEPKNARFIFMNLGRPEAAVRYQEWEKKFTARRDQGNAVQAWWNNRKVESITALRDGADLYNAKLLECTRSNGDALVDIASVISPEVITPMLKSLHLTPGAQAPVKSNLIQRVLGRDEKQHIDPAAYNNPKVSKTLLGSRNIITSDKVHPTDQVYKLIWKTIKETIVRKDYKFGKL